MAFAWEKTLKQLPTWFRTAGIEEPLFRDRLSLRWKQILDFSITELTGQISLRPSSDFFLMVDQKRQVLEKGQTQSRRPCCAQVWSNYRGKRTIVHREWDKSWFFIGTDLAPNHQFFSGTSISPLSWGHMEGGGAYLTIVRTSGPGEHTWMLPVAIAKLLQASTTSTNTSHTIVGLGARLPIEAQLTEQCLRILGRPPVSQKCAPCILACLEYTLPKSPASPFQGLVFPELP